MAIYNSTAITNREPVPGFGAGGGQIRTQYTTITVPAAATTSDVFNLFRLPPNVRVVGGYIKSADLDTGTTVTINVGDTGTIDRNGAAVAADADRYFAASTVGQTGTVSNTLAATGVFFTTGRGYTMVTASLQAGPTTTAGALEVALFYTVEEPQD